MPRQPKKWDVSLTDFQMKFFQSKSRFPAFVASWGTGKTMCGLLKSMDLSITYPGNLGLIVRKNFTDLKDSTMKDFHRYTGIKVPSNKDVMLPNGSMLMFRHLDELAGIKQNVNLGWFFIEQAEEFDTAEEFDFLDGRLRREGCFAQGFIIANTNGHNWVWRRWKNKGGIEYLCDKEYVDDKGDKVDSGIEGVEYDGYASLVEARSHDNPHLPAHALASWSMKKDTNPSQYRRYVLNSWEDTDTDDAVIPYEHIIRAVNADIFCLHEKRRIVCCDPAEFGDDKTIIMALEEGKIVRIEPLRKKEPMETAGRIVRMYRETGSTVAAIDSIGIGAGIRSRLGELGINVQGVNVGMKSSEPELYKNLKAEIWMNAQEMFRENLISLPDNDELIEDLAAMRYSTNSKGQVQTERKEDTKKRLGRSPDMGDCFVIGLYAIKSAGFEPVIEYEDLDSDIAESYSVKSVL